MFEFAKTMRAKGVSSLGIAILIGDRFGIKTTRSAVEGKLWREERKNVQHRQVLRSIN